VVQAVEIGGAH